MFSNEISETAQFNNTLSSNYESTFYDSVRICIINYKLVCNEYSRKVF